MENVAIVYYSGKGHTKKLAEAVLQGVNQIAGVNGQLLAIDANGNLPDGGWQILDDARGIIFGSPTYMGSTSWQFKKFADESSKRWFTQKWKDKVAAGFTNSASMNGDKLSTINYMMILAMQHGMIWVGTGMMPSNSKAAQRNDVNYMGAYSGLMSQSSADASAEESPPPGDLETGRLFGKRAAAVTLKWQKAA